jgi:hypothetical protein
LHHDDDWCGCKSLRRRERWSRGWWLVGLIGGGLWLIAFDLSWWCDVIRRGKRAWCVSGQEVRAGSFTLQYLSPIPNFGTEQHGDILDVSKLDQSNFTLRFIGSVFTQKCQSTGNPVLDSYLSCNDIAILLLFFYPSFLWFYLVKMPMHRQIVLDSYLLCNANTTFDNTILLLSTNCLKASDSWTWDEFTVTRSSQSW